jgi:hypothetical protein
MTAKAYASILILASSAWAASVAGITWTAPANWKSQGERPMRAATYTVPAAAGDKEDGECAVFYFGQGQGGDVNANIQRWLGQFQEKPAQPPKPTKKTLGGVNVTTIEHAGTYMAGAPMSPVKTPKPGYQLIGAIVEAPEGNVFFKLTGPAKTVAAAKPAFEKMLSSMKK